MIDRRTQAAYDTIAADFAARNATMPTELADFGARLLAEVAGCGPILDAGCGAGRDMAWLEARGARVVGADLSAGMLAQARTRVRSPLVQADLRRLPFPPATFAGLWCCAALLHLPKAEAPRALAELRRVLRPEGVLFLSIQEGAGEQWEGWPAAAVQRFFARYTPTEAAALLTAAGFPIVEARRSVTPQRRWLQFLARAAG